MSACSSCGGHRVDGCVRHTPTCPCYLPSDMLRYHPDLVEVAAEWERLFPDDVWPAAARRRWPWVA